MPNSELALQPQPSRGFAWPLSRAPPVPTPVDSSSVALRITNFSALVTRMERPCPTAIRCVFQGLPADG